MPVGVGTTGTEEVDDFSRNFLFTLTAVKRLWGAADECAEDDIEPSPEIWDVDCVTDGTTVVGCCCVPAGPAWPVPVKSLFSRNVGRLSEDTVSLDVLPRLFSGSLDEAFPSISVRRSVVPSVGEWFE